MGIVSQKCGLCIGYSMLCVGYRIYIRVSGAPSVYFIKSTKHCMLKTKSNFTMFIYIPFLSIGEWYIKCV